MNQVFIKNSTQVITLVIVFIFSFNFFQATPLETLFFQLQGGLLGWILFFLTGYIATFLIKRKRFNKIVIYYLLLIAIIPFYGAYRAGVEFGQPFIYGFLRERGWLLLGVGIWFYYQLSTKKMTIETIELAFVFMAWASLIIFSLFILTVDPSQLQNEEASKLMSLTEDRGLRFGFQTYFITFGAIYYFIKYSIQKSSKNVVFTFLFLGYILFITQGRSYIMTMAATFLLYFWFNYSLSRFALTAIKILLFFCFALMAIQFLMPDYLEQMSYSFSQVFQVLTGEESQDDSANARIFASRIVFDYFEAHPLSIWLGTGNVSNQWNDGGYKSVFGYFYPDDIGVLGVLFVYGIVGTFFVYLVPLVILIQTLRKASEKGDVFIMSLRYLLVSTLVTSILGSLYFYAIRYIIPLFILLAYFKLQDRARANQRIA